MKKLQHRHWFFLLSIFISTPITATVIPDNVDKQTIETMVLQTIQKHPSLQAKLQSVNASATRINKAKADFLPTIDFEGDIKKNKEYSPDKTNPTTRDSKITISQSVFSGFETIIATNEAIKNKEYEYFNYQASAEGLAIDVITSYLDYLEKKETVDLTAENLDTHIKIYAQIKQKTDQGVSKISDLIKVEGRKAKAHASLLSAKSNLVKATNRYFNLTGSRPHNLTIPNIKKLTLPESIEHALTKSVDKNPKVLAYNSAINAADYSYKKELSKLLPTLTANYSRMWNNTSNDEKASQEVSLKLQVNIFNGGKNYSDLKYKSNLLEEQKYARISLLQDIKEQITSSWNEISILREQLKHLDEYEQANKRVVSAYKEEFNLGKQTIITLLDSENELYQSNLSLTSAVYKQLLEHFRMLFLTGELLEQLNIKR